MGKKTSSDKQADFSWPLAIVIYSIFLGFIITSNGVTNWDDEVRITHSHWLLNAFSFNPKTNTPANYSYAPLWELTLGLSYKFLFSWMHNEIWVRHALTFSLLPIGLALLYYFFRKENISKWSCFLCIAGILSYIRLVGHATMNVKDFPGAIIYLLCAVGTWRILTNLKKNRFNMNVLLLLGIVTTIPFLIRSPLITLLPLSYIFLIFYVIERKKELHVFQILLTFILPIFSAVLFIFLFSPALWSLDIVGVKNSTIKFVEFPWGGYVSFFGLQYLSHNLPRWFVFTWIPVGITLPGLVVFLTGVTLLLRNIRHLPLQTIYWGTQKFRVSVTVIDWLALVTMTSFAAVIVIHPTLYDEDRHLLFLMLPLYTTGFLGLCVLSESMKKYITIILVIWSIFALYQWNIYAYVYRNPLITLRYKSYHFMSDYYGTCGSKAGAYLLALEEKSIPIMYSKYAGKIAITHAFEKNNEGYFSKKTTVKNVRPPNPGEPFWYLLIDTRSSDPIRNPGFFHTANIEKKWQDRLPTGETTCSLYLVTPTQH